MMSNVDPEVVRMLAALLIAAVGVWSASVIPSFIGLLIDWWKGRK